MRSFSGTGRLWHRLMGASVRRWLGFRLIEPDPVALAPEPVTLYVIPHPALSDELAVTQLTRKLGLPDAGRRVELNGLMLPACLPLARLRRTWRGVKTQGTQIGLAGLGLVEHRRLHHLLRIGLGLDDTRGATGRCKIGRAHV